MNPEIKLGDVARDTITGFQGVVISRHEYLNGCVRLSLQPTVLHEGKPIESHTFDVQQLALVTSAECRTIDPGAGGPHDEPARPKIPNSVQPPSARGGW